MSSSLVGGKLGMFPAVCGVFVWRDSDRLLEFGLNLLWSGHLEAEPLEPSSLEAETFICPVISELKKV